LAAAQQSGVEPSFKEMRDIKEGIRIKKKRGKRTKKREENIK